MPLSVPAFADDKNLLEGKGYILLFELEHEAGQFTRFARHTQNVSFEGFTWTKFPMGSVDIPQTQSGEIPVFNIAFQNVGREVQSLLEFYIIEGRPGRVLWVHPDKLADTTAKIEEKFIVLSAQADQQTATLSCSPIAWDIFGVQLPNKIVTVEEFPGVLGTRGKYF